MIEVISLVIVVGGWATILLWAITSRARRRRARHDDARWPARHAARGV